MQAVILAGGFGTRLKHVLPNVPKPMADINGRPFLAVLIAHLRLQGFTSFVICIHHMREQIIDYFRDYKEVRFSIEPSPLGTGGAIAHAIRQCGLNGQIAVMNGDSFLELDYRAFRLSHGDKHFSLALREVPDTARYGRVEIAEEIITSFKEKGEGGKGFINTGSYFIDSTWFVNTINSNNIPAAFSIENDFLLPKITEIRPGYYLAKGYFIDIGIPEDYARAQRDLAGILS